jgi:hypothetical protein
MVLPASRGEPRIRSRLLPRSRKTRTQTQEATRAGPLNSQRGGRVCCACRRARRFNGCGGDARLESSPGGVLAWHPARGGAAEPREEWLTSDSGGAPRRAARYWSAAQGGALLRAEIDGRGRRRLRGCRRDVGLGRASLGLLFHERARALSTWSGIRFAVPSAPRRAKLVGSRTAIHLCDVLLGRARCDTSWSCSGGHRGCSSLLR